MNFWTRRIAVVAAVVALGSLISMAPANAASGGIDVNPASVAPGETFTVSGGPDCIKSSELGITVEGLGLSESVSGDAAWEVTFTVPANAVADTYPVTVSGEECTFTDGVLTVTAPAPTTTVAPTTTTTAALAAKAAVVNAAPAFTG